MVSNYIHIPVKHETKKEIDLAKEEYKREYPDDNREITYDFIIKRIAMYYRGIRFKGGGF